jgi:hypothetical protein
MARTGDGGREEQSLALLVDGLEDARQFGEVEQPVGLVQHLSDGMHLQQ